VFLDVPGRVAKCLVDLGTAHARTEIELTQDDLAAFVEATRVSVNRALADLESQARSRSAAVTSRSTSPSSCGSRLASKPPRLSRP
jgi:CRP-like cAMP-binding protein